MTPDDSPIARDVLSQDEAVARARLVSDISYEIHLDLVAGASAYRGDVTIRFGYAAGDDGAAGVFLDHRGGGIERIEVNGEEIESPTGEYRIPLPASALQASNVVRVSYEHEYDHTGDGFHQFIDPEDGSEYLYSNFEPYNAHRLFPCFDQPDLKASYDLTVDAPSDWELIANGPELGREQLEDGRLRRRYAPPERFSTYLFALIAGPYHVVRDEHRGVPLGFYCRRSLVRHLEEDEPELFEVTKQGLDFFGGFFDYAYPFGKYDQIFVPEFNFGAMENIGAVTHSERMVFRDPPTDNQRLGRAEVLLHEMAHMWFGNLVTMRWWNDLWLNESFATYMAYLALVEATRFSSAWQAFNSGMKAWAYRQDQLVTTHPIAGQVRDTDETFLNFDGITYGKGAAVLKQLVAAVGVDGFREGMRIYFRRHAFGNTTLAEFLDAIGEGAGRDLHGWAALWLETASLNTLAASWEVEDGRLASLAITQTAPEDYPTLRPHRLDVALVGAGDDGGDGEPAIEALTVSVEGEGDCRRGSRRARRAAAGDAQPQRPRLREGRPRRALARLRLGPPRARRRSAAAAADLAGAVEHGARPATALDGLPAARRLEGDDGDEHGVDRERPRDGGRGDRPLRPGRAARRAGAPLLRGRLERTVRGRRLRPRRRDKRWSDHLGPHPDRHRDHARGHRPRDRARRRRTRGAGLDDRPGDALGHRRPRRRARHRGRGGARRG